MAWQAGYTFAKWVIHYWESSRYDTSTNSYTRASLSSSRVHLYLLLLAASFESLMSGRLNVFWCHGVFRLSGIAYSKTMLVHCRLNKMHVDNWTIPCLLIKKIDQYCFIIMGKYEILTLSNSPLLGYKTMVGVVFLYCRYGWDIKNAFKWPPFDWTVSNEFKWCDSMYNW